MSEPMNQQFNGRLQIILISGWAYPGQTMEPLAEQIDKHIGRRADMHMTSLCELIAQGASERQAPARPQVSFPAMALEKKIMALKDGSQCIVIGWSAGGMVALDWLTSTHVSSLAGLILIGTTPKFCWTATKKRGFPWGVDAKIVRAMIMALRNNPASVLNRFFQEASWPEASSEPGLMSIADMALALDLGIEALVDGLRYLQRIDLRAPINKIQLTNTQESNIGCATLIVHGRQDRIVPWQAATWLNENLPKSSISIHNGFGHDIPTRHPQILAKQAIGFLQEVQGEA